MSALTTTWGSGEVWGLTAKVWGPWDKPVYSFLIDWDNNGTFVGPYDDVTPYVHAANWFLGMKQAYQYMPDESEATFTLVNTTRIFSPENVASPLYGKMVPHRRMKVVSTNGYEPETTLWSGYVDYINPTPMQYKGPFLTEVRGVGPKSILSRAVINLALLEDVTTDEAIAAILDQVQVPPAFEGSWRLGTATVSELGDTTFLSTAELDTDLDVGDVILPFVGDNWDNFTNAFDAISTVVLAEQGKLFFSRTGEIVFWNRSRFQGTNTIFHTFGDTFFGIEYSYGKEIYNRIKVTYYPRFISASSTDVLWTLDEPLTIPAGEEQTIQANFNSEEGVKIGGKDVVIPNTVDGTLVVGSGAATISDSEIAADSLKMTFTNAGGVPAVITTLVVKGKRISAFNSQTVEEYDGYSISYYGQREKSIDLKLVTDIDDARGVAQSQLLRYKEPAGRVRSISMYNRDIDWALRQLALETGIVIGVGETQTQHTNQYVIVGEQFEYRDNGTNVKSTVYLEPLTDLTPWLLGVTDRSELGTSTLLGL